VKGVLFLLFLNLLNFRYTWARSQIWNWNEDKTWFWMILPVHYLSSPQDPVQYLPKHLLCHVDLHHFRVPHGQRHTTKGRIQVERPHVDSFYYRKNENGFATTALELKHSWNPSGNGFLHKLFCLICFSHVGRKWKKLHLKVLSCGQSSSESTAYLWEKKQIYVAILYVINLITCTC